LAVTLPETLRIRPAQGIALVGVGVDPPVLAVQVFVDGGFHVHQGLAVGAQLGVLLAVDDVGAGGLQVVGGDQGLLHHVLDLLDGRAWLCEVMAKRWISTLVTWAVSRSRLVGRTRRWRRRRESGRNESCRHRRHMATVAFDGLAGQGKLLL
jgi:hypothetical protein